MRNFKLKYTHAVVFLLLFFLIVHITSIGCLSDAMDNAFKEMGAVAMVRLGIFDLYWQYRLVRSPERATYLGDHRFNDRLFDYGTVARTEDLKFNRDILKFLRDSRGFDFDEQTRLNAALLELAISDHLDLAEFPEHLMPIKQQNSPHIELGTLQSYHPFDTPKGCADYAARLRAFDRQVTDLIALMDEGIKRGVVRPKITIEQTLPQIEAMITADAKDCTLYAPAKTLSDAAGGEESRKLIEKATADAIVSLSRLRDYLRDTYLPACRETVGYCHLPNGKAWYRRLAKHHTTTDLAPEKIHQIGLDELKRIHADMEKIAREVGFDGDAKAFIEHVRNDPAQYNRSAAEIMQRHREILAITDANLPTLFGTLPKIPYELKELEPFRSESAPAGYYYNAPDDLSRPAYFYVNTYKPETRPIYTMEALAYHEAQPGHHLQIALAQQRKDLPDFRRFEHINAFIEGWALYSELLGYDLGGYRDPYSRFGQLTFDAWRSARLVVDTGMHWFGWTRERAIEFMKDNTGLSELDIVSEVDRYIAWPGQALSYKIGQIEVLRLRKEAEEALGEKFDVRAWHDHLLAEGSLPLTMLTERMNKWVEGQREVR